MAYLSQHYQVISLLEMVERMARKPESEERFVAVTFDDGYSDNLINAKPILDFYRIPATVFVSTGFIEGTKEFWWDELEHLLLHPSVLPDSLRLEIGKSVHEWKLGRDADYTKEGFEEHRLWNVLRTDDPTNRHRVYRELCRIARPLQEEQRQDMLCMLREWAGRKHDRHCEHRALTSDEVRQLASGSSIDVGAHTETHPVLATLSVDSQRQEIAQSQKRLEEILKRPVRSFAYPYGTKADYTGQTATLVREQGFGLACSNYPEAIVESTDRYQLPRFVVRDWSEDRFIRTLTSCWDGTSGEDAYAA